MEIATLRWFQLVADGLTVTEVAETGFISQPAVSRALARLDDEVGAPLLRREGRGLRMTQAGAAFKRHVDSLLHRLDDGLAAVSQLVDPETGTVAIATQRSLGSWLLPNLVGTFHPGHPDVRFEVRRVFDDPTPTATGEERVDLEITTVRPAERGIEWWHLFDERLVLAVPRGHRLADRPGVLLAEVAGEPFVNMRAPSLLGRQATALCRAAGFDQRVVFEGEDIPTLRGFVAAGLGVAIVPAARPGDAAAGTGSVRRLPILDRGASREIGIGWSTQRPLLPSAELFRLHVLALAAAGELPLAADSPT